MKKMKTGIGVMLALLPSAFRFPPTGLLRAAGHGLRRTAQMYFLRGPVRL